MNPKLNVPTRSQLKLSLPLRALFTAISLALLPALPSTLQAAVPDLTAAGAIAKIDRTWTYNLGPTGMRGWIYHAWSVTAEQDATTGFAPYQILVTTVAPKTPASGILAADDVILGASAGSGAVPLFTGDARKSLGWAIGAAEAGNGILKLKRWRAGVAADVSITLPVMGAYSDTAPYNCPKTARIMANAANSLQQTILKNGWGGGDGSGAISAMDTLLAALLLTAVSATGAKDPDSTIAVNDRRELLVDELLAEKSSGEARLQNHQPVPREIMLPTGVPWERSEERS